MCVVSSEVLLADEPSQVAQFEDRGVRTEQYLFHLLPPFGAEPTRKWKAESLLSPQVERGRKQPFAESPQENLPLGPRRPQSIGNTGKCKFNQPVVQERRTNLE